jgi:hypothetical protein
MNKMRILLFAALAISLVGYRIYLEKQTTQQSMLEHYSEVGETTKILPPQGKKEPTQKPQEEALLIGQPVEFSHVWRNTLEEQTQALQEVTSDNLIEELKNITAWTPTDVQIWEGHFEGTIDFDDEAKRSQNIEVSLEKLPDGQRRHQWIVMGTAGQEGHIVETLWQDDLHIPFPSMTKYVERDETSYIFPVDYNGQKAYAHIFSPSTDPDYFIGILYVSSAPSMITRAGTVTLRR